MSITNVRSPQFDARDLGLDSDPQLDLQARARALNAAPQRNATSAFKPGDTTSAAPADLFSCIGGLFSGTTQGNGQQSPELFDLGAILGQVFDLVGQLFGAAAASPTSSMTQVRAGVKEQASVSGEWTDGHVTAKGSANAEAHATAEAFGETFTDAKGSGVRGGAEATVGASVDAQGSVETDVGSIAGHARLSAEAYARLYGEARAGQDGLRAAGKAEAGAAAKASADANAELLGGLVAGKADARAESGVGAQATGKATVCFDPPEAAVNANAGAFAGARAGFSATGGIAGCGYGVAAEAWSGAGVKAEFNAGLEDGKFKLSYGVGIAVGVGAYFKVDVEIDTKDLGTIVTGVVGAAGGIVGSVFGAVGKGVGDTLGALFGAVGGLFGGGKGDGSHASRCLDQALGLQPSPGAPSPIAPVTPNVLEVEPEPNAHDDAHAADWQPAT